MRTTDYVKIGVTSTSIKNRVRAVQTGTPTPIFYVEYFNLHSRSLAFELEKSMHKKLNKRRTFGEWFSNVRENSKEVEEVLKEYGLTKKDIVRVHLKKGTYVMDEIETASKNIDRYVKLKKYFALAGLGSKIYSLKSIVRVKELEKKYQEAVKSVECMDMKKEIICK